MTYSTSSVTCSSCNAKIDPANDPMGGERPPCQVCGSTARTVSANVRFQVRTSVSLGYELKRPGFAGGPALKVSVRNSVQRTTGKQMKRTMVIDRITNSYREQVIDPETGEVIHKTDEPLSEHRGHGSARKDPPDA